MASAVDKVLNLLGWYDDEADARARAERVRQEIKC